MLNALTGCKTYNHPVHSPMDSGAYKGTVYEDTLTGFQEAGFVNIETEETMTTSTAMAGTVIKVTIDGQTLYNTANTWENDVPVEISCYVLELFEPTMQIETSGDDGKPEFIIKSNLPDKTKLALDLMDDNLYTAQQTVTVKNGEAKSEKFTSEDDLPLAGTYTLTVVMDPSEQSFLFTSPFGANGERLTGPLVEQKSTTGGQYLFMEYEYTSPYSEDEIAEAQAAIEAEKSKPSVGDIVMLMGMSLMESYGSNYDLNVDGNIISISVWNDGVAAGAFLAANGETELLNAWNTMAQNILTMANNMQALLDTNDYGTYQVSISVVNDLNRDNTMLVATRGAIVYDFVNGIDIIGIGN